MAARLAFHARASSPAAVMAARNAYDKRSAARITNGIQSAHLVEIGVR